MDVRDKVVAITGGGRGPGQGFARALAAAGAKVVVGDLSDCSETLALVKEAGSDGLGVRLDVTDPASARAMVETAAGQFGRLDALINNAALYGALHGGRFDQLD